MSVVDINQALEFKHFEELEEEIIGFFNKLLERGIPPGAIIGILETIKLEIILDCRDLAADD